MKRGTQSDDEQSARNAFDRLLIVSALHAKTLALVAFCRRRHNRRRRRRTLRAGRRGERSLNAMARTTYAFHTNCDYNLHNSVPLRRRFGSLMR